MRKLKFYFIHQRLQFWDGGATEQDLFIEEQKTTKNSTEQITFISVLQKW